MSRREVVQIRCTTQEKEKWRDVAASQHMEMSAWIRLVLDKATRPGAETPMLPQTRVDFTPE